MFRAGFTSQFSQHCSRLFVCAVVLMTAACAPRGETKTLDEILRNSQEYYATAVDDSKISDQTKSTLDALTKNLDTILNPKTSSSAQAISVAEHIAALIPHAGYTNRPAMTQLIRQWRELAGTDHYSKNAAAKPRKDMEFSTSPAIRLLVARTFRTLAREVAANGFAV